MAMVVAMLVLKVFHHMVPVQVSPKKSPVLSIEALALPVGFSRTEPLGPQHFGGVRQAEQRGVHCDKLQGSKKDVYDHYVTLMQLVCRFCM